MKKLFLVSILFLVIFQSFGQLNISQSTYSTFDGRSIPVYIIEANYTVINIDTSVIKSYQLNDTATLQKVVTRVDTLYAFYKNNLGYEPAGGNINYSNKANVFFGPPSCGSGCGLIGAKGIEVDGFENIFYNLKHSLNVNRDVIIGYEFGRNFFDFSSKILFPFQPNSGQRNGGFAEGFAGLMYLFAYDEILNSSQERQLNETLLNLKWNRSSYLGYINDTSANPYNCYWEWQLDGIIDPNRGRSGHEYTAYPGVTSLYAIFDIFGRQNLFPNFFINIRNQPVVVTIEDALSNIAYSASLSLNANLNAFFKNVLKFNINSSTSSAIESFPRLRSKLIKDLDRLYFFTPFEKVTLNLRSTNYLNDTCKYLVKSENDTLSFTSHGNNEFEYSILKNQQYINLQCYLINSSNIIIDSFVTRLQKRDTIKFDEIRDDLFAYYLSNKTSRCQLLADSVLYIEGLQTDSLKLNESAVFWSTVFARDRVLKLDGDVKNISPTWNSSYPPVHGLPTTTGWSGIAFQGPARSSGSARVGYDIAQNDTVNFYHVSFVDSSTLFIPAPLTRKYSLNNIFFYDVGYPSKKAFFKNIVLTDITDTDSDGIIDFSDSCPQYPNPVPNFSNSNEQCLSVNIFTFNNTSSILSGTMSHFWSFGDGTTSTALNPTKSYAAAGTYIVKLVSISNNGCKDSITRQVTVHPMPASSYSINTAAQCLTGNSFRFTNSSTIASGTLTSHVWSFGDGGTATTLNATKTYSSAGTYSVKLVSTSNDGCKDSTTQQVVVNPMPSTAYSINTAAQCLSGNSFGFTNSSSISSGTLSHLWTFGDGGTASTLNATKSYVAPGTYSVKLLSTSNNGCKDSTSQQVVVNPMPASSYTINTAAQCLTDNSFTFTNSSTLASGTLTSHLWSFGDGGTATTLNATRSYVAPGIYPVKLVSTSNNGCKDSTTRQVTVHPMPVSGFTVNPAIQCLTGNSFSFNNTSTVSGGTTNSNWNFGNGSTSTNQSPMFTYANVGAFTVKLVSTSNNGCKDSATRSVRIDVSPTATLNVAPYRSIHPGILTTINASIAPAGTYKYTWYRSNQLISNETTTSVDSIGYRLWSGAYKMAIENLPPQLPCSYTTPELVIGDSVSSKLFIYPNPNNGQFRVTYYSPTNTRYQVVVMDTKGAVLYRKPHEVTNRYQLIDINLQGASSGLYLLQIQDPTGKQLASGQLVIH
jgi:PKD repeat protein